MATIRMARLTGGLTLMLWLYLHFPKLQLDSRHRQQQEQPLAIVCPKQHQLLQVNDSARQLGLSPRMGLATAATLCHSLEAVAYSEEVSVQALNRLARKLYQVTADISLWPTDGLLLRVTPMLMLSDGLTAYWQKIKATIPSWLEYHYACAHTPDAARLLAQTKAQLVTQCHSTIEKQLSQRSVRALDCSDSVKNQLLKVGVRTVSDLLSIPSGELSRRFDHQFIQYIHRLTGLLPHPVNWYHPPDFFQSQLELFYESDNIQHLLKPILRLLRQLADYWIERDKTSQHIYCMLLLRDAPACNLTISAAEPSRNPGFWFRLTELKLESVKLTGPVYAVRLVCHQLLPYQGHNTALLEHQKAGNAAILLSTLENKLGPDAVLSPFRQDDHRPEVRNRYKPVSQHAASPCLSVRHRPGLLLAEPQPLTEKIRIVQGPERIETGWWDHHPIHRDYFVATTMEGSWYWVFRTPDNHWFLHGFFS